MQEQINQQFNRRKFLTSIGLIGAAVGFSPLKGFSETTPIVEGATGNMKCKPYLQAVKTDRINIRWITNSPCHSWVEYGENPQTLNQKAQQTEDGMVQVDNTVHAITLSNLLPGKTYYYRAVSRKTENMERKRQSFGEPGYSEVYSFTTLSKDMDSVEFVVFNDLHDRPESFAALMKQSSGKKDFVLLNGDILSKVEDENQIVDHLINPLTDLGATTIPFFFARGNHETWSTYARELGKYVDGGENKYYYSFQYGPMYGIVLDSGETKSDEDPVNGGIIDFDAYREQQGKWLEKEVQKKSFKKAKYKVVFMHIPAYYLGGDAHASEHYNEIWGPIFNVSKIDLMLCGHTHKSGIHQPVKGQHEYPIVIGGGPKDGNRTIIDIKITGQALNLKMIDDRGETLGTLNL